MQIDVQDLTIARGGVALLSGVSFSVPASEAVILRGPNGLGKTTLLRTLAGLQPPLAGTVQVPEDSVAYAAHADGLKTMLSVAENLEFWAAVFGAGSIEPALDAFDLHSLRTRRAGTLSAGQKRRLGLARLLVTGRPIWILDEPTVSLDAASVTQFGQVMAEHLGKGGSAVLATHIDLGLIGARTLELGPFKARPDAMTSTSDEAFL